MNEVRSVRVGGSVLGAPGAAPAVVVPVLGSSPAEVLAQATALTGRAADILEWRVDHLADPAPASVAETARRLGSLLDGRPLLATVRTAAEGGEADLPDTGYAELVRALIGSGAVELVDVEHSRDARIVADLLTAGREARVPVLLSCHDFAGTPAVAEMVGRLRAMQETGADLVKLAVTPHERAEVAALLEATAVFYERHARVPVITMAMGELGLITRLGGHLFGSAATFASAGRSSAPGQPSLTELHEVLGALERLGSGG